MLKNVMWVKGYVLEIGQCVKIAYHSTYYSALITLDGFKIMCFNGEIFIPYNNDWWWFIDQNTEGVIPYYNSKELPENCLNDDPILLKTK